MRQLILISKHKHQKTEILIMSAVVVNCCQFATYFSKTKKLDVLTHPLGLW